MKLMILVASLVMSSAFAGSAEELTRVLSNKHINQEKLEVNGEVMPTQDCSKDDVTYLNANGTYTYTANTPCDEEDGDETGSWEVYEVDGSLFIATTTDDETEELQVLSYTSNKLVLFVEYEEEGYPIMIKLTFKIK